MLAETSRTTIADVPGGANACRAGSSRVAAKTRATAASPTSASATSCATRVRRPRARSSAASASGSAVDVTGPPPRPDRRAARPRGRRLGTRPGHPVSAGHESRDTVARDTAEESGGAAAVGGRAPFRLAEQAHGAVELVPVARGGRVVAGEARSRRARGRRGVVLPAAAAAASASLRGLARRDASGSSTGRRYGATRGGHRGGGDARDDGDARRGSRFHYTRPDDRGARQDDAARGGRGHTGKPEAGDRLGEADPRPRPLETGRSDRLEGARGRDDPCLRRRRRVVEGRLDRVRHRDADRRAAGINACGDRGGAGTRRRRTSAAPTPTIGAVRSASRGRPPAEAPALGPPCEHRVDLVGLRRAYGHGIEPEPTEAVDRSGEAARVLLRSARPSRTHTSLRAPVVGSSSSRTVERTDGKRYSQVGPARSPA